MAPTSWLENVSAPRAPRYGVCVGGRNSLFMCKLCVPSQPLGSTTVINTSANVASGTAWQHLARRTARPHLQCSRWISVRLKACGIEIPLEHVLVTSSFLWQNM